MNFSIEISRKISLAYNVVCKPLCQKLGLPKTAFDILMFLGNNPKYKTAGEIVEIRCIKANLVSVNVERLVREGYLTRRSVKGDRRKTELICTEKALPVIAEGQKLQNMFFEQLFTGMTPEIHDSFLKAMRYIENNLNKILEENSKK